jgi:hypothetical protein
VTWLWLGDLEISVKFSTRAEVSLLHSVHTGFGVNTASCPGCTSILSKRAKLYKHIIPRLKMQAFILSTWYVLQVRFMLGLFFYPEDGGEMFSLNVG